MDTQPKPTERTSEQQLVPDRPISIDRVTLRDLYTIAQAGREDTANVKRDLQFSIDQMQQQMNIRFNGQDARIAELVQTTNHHLEDFEQAMENRRVEVNLELNRLKSAGGIKASEVAAVLAGQFVRSRLAWALTIAFFLGGAPVIIDHWHDLFDRVIALF